MKINGCDYIGEKFGKLTLVRETGLKSKNRSTLWEFKCDCGNTKLYPLDWVISGTTKSCGCGRFHFDDLTGMRFGRLVVVEYVGRHGKNKSPYWKCQCDCGKETFSTRAQLRRGRKKSCGCLASEATRKRSTRHGLHDSRIYTIWCGMKERCYNQSQQGAKNYVARGITVCDEWINDFRAFYDWSMANGYRDELTIDRIDNDKGYSPDNCRWATRIVQNNNTRANRIITHNGETHTMAEWARILGIPSTTLRNRIHRGWSEEEALTIPYGISRKNYSKLRKD